MGVIVHFFAAMPDTENRIRGRSDIAFVIGGPFGLPAQLTGAADERLSFSPMTFTHQMIRLLLVEQIYREFKINAGEPYHW